MMWPQEVFRTKNGGHTYLGFSTQREPSMLKKGIVEPVPAENWNLLSDEDQEAMRNGFKELGYEIREVGDDRT